MTGNDDQGKINDVSKMLARGVRMRIGLLVLASSVAVALIFGLSFYFALISNESAVARQIPGLEDVAAQLKNLLVMNTLAFVGVIILSFLALSSIVTARMFHTLAVLHRELLALAEGKVPRPREAHEGGPFTALTDAFGAAASGVRDRERKEIERLGRVAVSLAGVAAASSAVRELEAIQSGKRAFIGETALGAGTKAQEPESDSLFIQPL